MPLKSLPIACEPLSHEHISLVPFTKEHISSTYISWLNSPTITKFSQQRHRVHTQASCADYLSSIEKNQHFMWAILIDNKTASTHIGNIVAYVDRINLTANLTIMIGEQNNQTKGAGSRSFKLALEWLLQNGLRKVYAGTMANNKAMLRVMEKCNMTIEGIYPKHFYWEEQEVDMVIASLFFNE